MSNLVLLTSAQEDSEKIAKWTGQHKVGLLHLPLERYTAITIDDNDWKKPEEFENIVFGNKRNAIFFLEEVRRRNELPSVQKRVNIALDSPTTEYLEQAGIPAVSAFGESKPIDLIEFMLRLRRTGPTLYPCGLHTREEIPGFLEELDIPVYEFGLYDLKGPTQETLESHRSVLDKKKPDVVIFHSRRSVTRTLTAFPALDLSSSTIIAGDAGVTQKLKEEGVAVTAEAEGSWESIIEKLSKQL